MKVSLCREADRKDEKEVSRVYILIGETEYKISEDKFRNLILNKSNDEDSSIYVTPQYSNEIRIK